MPEYKTPGVYVEVQKGSPPIEPVGTSTAAFIGLVPDNVPMPITASGLPMKLTQASLDRLKTRGVPDAVITKLNSLKDKEYPSLREFQAAVKGALTAEEFNKYNAAVVDEGSPRQTVHKPSDPVVLTNFDQFVTNFGLVQKSDVNKGNSTLAHAVFGFFLNGGAKCYVARVTDWGTGAVSNEVTATIAAFARIDDISIVAAPGAPKETQEALMDHCEALKYRFAVLDGKQTAADFQPGTVTDVKNSKFAAVYFPWITVSNLTLESGDTPTVELPPSGHVAGLMARVDIEQGVHYSPANENLRGALALKYLLSNAEQGDLNIAGINVTRNFRGNITVWGARTRATGADGEFKYVSVQRTMSMIAQSIDDGTKFVVFKPNNPKLWEQIKRTVRGFLTNTWRDGALFGNSPDEAFYVRCDEGTNPPEVRALGRVVIEVGVAIVQPAEFVIFRISQLAQASS